MRHLASEMIVEAINQQENRFDCHDVERRLIRDHAVATAKDIIAYEHSGDPLKYFSAVLSKYIDTAFRPQLRKLEKVITPNLGGKLSLNQQWEKLRFPITTPEMAIDVYELAAEVTGEDLRE
jgi:hypothetical protein